MNYEDRLNNNKTSIFSLFSTINIIHKSWFQQKTEQILVIYFLTNIVFFITNNDQIKPNKVSLKQKKEKVYYLVINPFLFDLKKRIKQ